MGSRKGIKEWLRKKVVSIKRNPQKIGLIAFAITFLYYSLNLTCISNTTAKIQGSGMGLCGFVTMLFSMLSLLCYMNSFPRRKKVNKPMLIIFIVMIGIILFCDYRYRDLVYYAVALSDNPIVITESTIYILEAYNMLLTHMILLVVSLVLMALGPVFKMLLNKINTNVNIDGYDKMEAIDISAEE